MTQDKDDISCLRAENTPKPEKESFRLRTNLLPIMDEMCRRMPLLDISTRGNICIPAGFFD